MLWVFWYCGFFVSFLVVVPVGIFLFVDSVAVICLGFFLSFVLLCVPTPHPPTTSLGIRIR